MSGPPGLVDALERCLQRGLTFAAFRMPGGTDVQVWAQHAPGPLPTDAAPVADTFLIAPFDGPAGRRTSIRPDVRLRFDGTTPDLSVLDRCKGHVETDGPTSPPTERSAFLRNVEAAKAAFAQGTLTKVVLSRTMDVPFDRRHLPALFIRALEASTTTFLALVHAPGYGLWIGASPEQLVHERNRHVRVDALAGTMPAATAPTQAAAWGPKERDEQELVTRHVAGTFARLALEHIRLSGPEVVRAGPVAHLRTVVEADLGACALSDLVHALHPTPAVGGTPADAAKRFILSHEGHDRMLYSGFWGPWDTGGATDLFVNIRCMRLHAREARLFVGAGITAGSDAELEWTETDHKAATWLRLMDAS